MLPNCSSSLSLALLILLVVSGTGCTPSIHKAIDQGDVAYVRAHPDAIEVESGKISRSKYSFRTNVTPMRRVLFGTEHLPSRTRADLLATLLDNGAAWEPSYTGELASYGTVDMVNTALYRGLSVNAADQYGCPMLWRAAQAYMGGGANEDRVREQRSIFNRLLDLGAATHMRCGGKSGNLSFHLGSMLGSTVTSKSYSRQRSRIETLLGDVEAHHPRAFDARNFSRSFQQAARAEEKRYAAYQARLARERAQPSALELVLLTIERNAEKERRRRAAAAAPLPYYGGGKQATTETTGNDGPELDCWGRPLGSAPPHNPEHGSRVCPN